MKLDKKDFEILYELDKNSRQTNKQIAKKIKISEQVAGNRIKKLQDKGVIENFLTKTNPAFLGYMHLKIYLRLHNLNKQKETELLKNLEKQPNIYWLASLRGKYDLVTSIYVKDISDFTNKYEKIFDAWKEYILERNIIVLEKAFTYTRTYLNPKQKPERILYSQGKKELTHLDELDISLLKILNSDGRRTLVDLAEKLGVSADTINYRIKNLQKKGIITGFGIKLNHKKIGNNYSLLSLKLQGMSTKKYEELEQFAFSHKNVIIFIKTIGDHDIELEIETNTKEEIDSLLRTLRDNFVNEIKNYEILEVTREHRMTYYPF